MFGWDIKNKCSIIQITLSHSGWVPGNSFHRDNNSQNMANVFLGMSTLMAQKAFGGEEEYCSMMPRGPKKLYPFYPRKKREQFISVGKRQYSVVIKSIILEPDCLV